MKILALLTMTMTLWIANCGCSERVDTPSLEILAAELRNPAFRWHGPCSLEDRIPSLHAARALAYIGDDAVEILFAASSDEDVDIISILDALSEIGIPVEQFHENIMNRNLTTTREWWGTNQAATIQARNKHRLQIGLPPCQHSR